MIHLNLTYSTAHAVFILIGWGLLLLIGCCWYYRNNKIEVNKMIFNLFCRYRAKRSESGYNSGSVSNSILLPPGGDAYKTINMRWNNQFMDFPLKSSKNSNDKRQINNGILHFEAILNRAAVQEDEEAFLKDVEYERNLNKPVEKIYAN